MVLSFSFTFCSQQAQARCHRIGQTKDVRVYRLITSRSFEQEMFDRASKKLGLEQAVLGTFGQEDEDEIPSSKEMEQLLKKGAYALIEDENDEIGKEFCADDIDSILAKRTRTRVVEGAKSASWLNKAGMIVSKSRFAAEESASAKVDVDDPMFWQKVMPDFVTPTIMLTKLDELTALVEGKKKGPGRGRWRKQREEQARRKEEELKAEQAESESKDEASKLEGADGSKTEDTKPEDVVMEAEPATFDAKSSDAATDKPDDAKGPSQPEDEPMEDAANPSQADGETPQQPMEASKPDEDMEEAKPSESTGDGENGKDGSPAKPEEEDKENEGDDEEEEKSEPEPEGYNLSKTNISKVKKYMADLKSMMDGIFVDAEDDSLPPSEKALCQKLLLTISVKDRIFNDEQRKLARNMLKRLEGDRRRRCRTSMEQPDRLSTESFRADGNTEVREELLILSKHQRKRRRQKERESMGGPAKKKTKRESNEYVGEDGYLHHSDSEEDWSDVGDDPYQSGKKKPGISLKEANRRRAWATESDAATAAGRPWPALPRHLVKPILSTLLEEVTKYDEEKGGIFSTPVPRDEFPEYYEVIEHPMDYGTMKQKLERGEYRSAQAMQKDFILVMQNCLKFNDKSSEIVSEARQQALMRPGMLRKAAMKHKIFLAEDGSALEVDDDEGDSKSPKKKRKRKKKGEEEDADEKDGEDAASQKIPRKKKVCCWYALVLKILFECIL